MGFENLLAHTRYNHYVNIDASIFDSLILFSLCVYTTTVQSECSAWKGNSINDACVTLCIAQYASVSVRRFCVARGVGMALNCAYNAVVVNIFYYRLTVCCRQCESNVSLVNWLASSFS